MPVFGFKESDPIPYNDDLDVYGCPWAQKIDEERFPAESTYTDYMWLMPLLTEPIIGCFELDPTSTFTFIEMYNYCDTILSREFEGIPMCTNTTYILEEA